MRKRLTWLGRPRFLAAAITGSLAIFAGKTSLASDAGVVGVSTLRAAGVNLDGSGVTVAQVEAQNGGSSPAFEVNSGAFGLTGGRITYFIGPPTTYVPQSSTAFPNSFGSESGHADAIANLFYGPANGMSTNVAHVDNYEADYFVITIVPSLTAINDRIVNQSFTLSSVTNAQQTVYDSYYDNYAANYNTLFVSAAGDSGTVY